MAFLGVLTLLALLPIIPLQARQGPLVPRLAAIGCAFVIGQMFRGAEDGGQGLTEYVLAVVLAAVPWILLNRWKRRTPSNSS